MCLRTEERGGGVEGAPPVDHGKIVADLYGAVTGEDGLAVTCCQSGGGVDGVEVNDGSTGRFLQSVTVPRRGTFTSSSSQNQPGTFYITSTDRCMSSRTLFLLFQ